MPHSGTFKVWRTIILQKFSHRSKSSEPYTSFPSLGPGHWEKKPRSIDFEGQWDLSTGAAQDWVGELHPWRVHIGSCMPQEPKEKQ